jgi:hypothetical protein
MTDAAIPANSSDAQSKGRSQISRRQPKQAAFGIAVVSSVVAAADYGRYYRKTGQYLVSTADAYVKADYTKPNYPLPGKPTGKFEYPSPNIVDLVQRQMGFQVNYTKPFGTGIEVDRDLYLVARLLDVERVKLFEPLFEIKNERTAMRWGGPIAPVSKRS